MLALLARLAPLAMALLAVAQMPERLPPPPQELIDETLAAYREEKDPQKRAFAIALLAATTLDTDPDPSPAVARALAVGLEDESWVVRRTAVVHLRREHRPTVRELLPPAAIRLARDAKQLAAREEEARPPPTKPKPPPTFGKDGKLVGSFDVAGISASTRHMAVLIEVWQMREYADSLMDALAEQGDEPALEGLLALSAGALQPVLGSRACLRLARFPVRKALEPIIERFGELEWELLRAEDEVEKAERARPSKRVPRGWKDEAWAKQEERRLAAELEAAKRALTSLQRESDAMREALAERARGIGLPLPSASDARRGTWQHWWHDARELVPEAFPDSGGG